MKALLLFPVIFLVFSLTPIMAQQKDSGTLFTRKTLADVIIKNKRPFIEVQVDKVVLNVQSDIVASSGNMFELLQRAPGVSVTNDETINLAGKAGVNILIDGRPTQLSAKDLANYLKSTPASLADKIEIITNPSSKYDAQGNAGIINIRLKKNTVKGTNGSISSTYTQSDHGNINLSGNLNHRRNKWNWFTNVAARKSRQNTTGSINRFVNSNGVVKTFTNNTIDRDASENINFRAGADWYMNRSNTFGFIVKGNEYRSSLYTPGVTLISRGNTVDSSLRTLNDNTSGNSRYNYNLNYKYEDTLGNEFNMDADYATYKNDNKGLVTTDLLNAQNIKYGFTANDQDVLTRINIYSFRADLTRQMRKQHAKIETGLKWNTVETVNDLDAFIWQNNAFVADTGRANRFDYKETVYAGYFNFNQKLGKWEYQLGVRTEWSVIKGNNIDLRNIRISYPDTSYFNVFPTVFLRYTLNDKNSFGLSYSRRINRPTYQDLNPFEYIYDNYSREKGNPYLLPEFTHNIELNYSYRGALNMAFGYSNTSNFFQGITTQDGEVTRATNLNVGNEYRYYLNLSLGIPVTKWWDMYNNLSPFYKEFRGEIKERRLDNSAAGMNWYTSHTFSLPEKWKIQLSSWGNLATRDALNNSAWLGSVDAGIGKSIIKDRMNLRLSVTDIFNTQKWRQVTQFGDVNFNYYRKWESRGLRLQMTWKFGKSSYRARERELGAREEIDRIK